MVLIGRRQLRSNNSWMHNLPALVKGKDRCTVQIHPDDAERLGLADGGHARVSSAAGELVVPVEVTDEIMPGVVSIPHGWGHDEPGNRMAVAVAQPGVNSNVLAPVDVDVPSGNAVLNGIPVEVGCRRPRARARRLTVLGKTFDLIDDHLRGWIARQPLFFVATAPLDADGHVNVSPKGPIGSLQVTGEREVAYLDVVGSGAETIAHLRENGRIVVMLCAFNGPPRIVRLHGRGIVLTPDEPRFAELLAAHDFAEPQAESRAPLDRRRRRRSGSPTHAATACR